MNFINWFDWITPTNPFASLFFGILFTIILGMTVWVETKNVKTVFITALTGIIITGIGVSLLKVIGYYS
ncbi:hypothetical protein [Halobacillus mangrovi]|uniref:DUF2759 domain-containing protein n=1 Tax=Halobacillus mangrovi TaxID=402384 RepID=A0A1W5ZQN1_9BACI|nr:hypothetical protein [Halobacillus mangrovi]ARI75595.1 hypothetical protein HM131_01590 [Halobacillus mangrovi]